MRFVSIAYERIRKNLKFKLHLPISGSFMRVVGCISSDCVRREDKYNDRGVFVISLLSNISRCIRDYELYSIFILNFSTNRWSKWRWSGNMTEGRGVGIFPLILISFSYLHRLSARKRDLGEAKPHQNVSLLLCYKYISYFINILKSEIKNPAPPPK